MKTDILRRPFLTEKATLNAEKGIYTFEVAPGANKLEIAKAVKSRFGVEVASVQTSWLPAKSKSSQTRKRVVAGTKQARKKAVVHLRKGFTIDLFAAETKEAGAL